MPFGSKRSKYNPWVKPRIWGPESHVRSNIARGHRDIGINPSDLMAYWPFWDPTGYRAHDYSGRRNHGVSTDGQPVRREEGFLFADGNDDRFVVADNDRFETTELLVCCWIKATQELSSIQRLLSRWDTKVWQLFLWDRDVAFEVPDGYNRTSYKLPIGEWHHIAWLHSKTDQESTLFVDGQVYVYDNYDGNIPTGLSSDLGIGAQASGSYSLDGAILDDVRLYSMSSPYKEEQVKFIANNPYYFLYPIHRPIIFPILGTIITVSDSGVGTDEIASAGPGTITVTDSGTGDDQVSGSGPGTITITDSGVGDDVVVLDAPISLSEAFRKASNASETGEVWCVLLEIDHPDWTEPARVTNCGKDITSKGRTFIHAPFELQLDTQAEDESPQMSLSIDNVERELLAKLQSITDGDEPSVTVEAVLYSDPDDLEMRRPGFILANARWDQLTIQAELRLELLERYPFPEGSYHPQYFPGM